MLTKHRLFNHSGELQRNIMFCVFLNPDSDKTSLAETLEANVAGLQDKEQAARTKTYQSANQVFGCAYDDIVKKGVAAASSNRMSKAESATGQIFTSSRLLRKMGDPVIAKASMNIKDGDQISDAAIIAQHVAGCLARVKWTKGRNVMKALRGMKLAGIQPRSSKRISVTELGGKGMLPTATTATPNAGVAEDTAPDSPKPADDTPFIPVTNANDMLKAINGTFAFVVYDTKRDMLFVARSINHSLNGKTVEAPMLYWAVDTLNNQVIVSLDAEQIPAHLAASEFPAGHFAWVGRSGAKELPQTHMFAEQASAPAPADASAPEKIPMAAEDAQAAPIAAA